MPQRKAQPPRRRSDAPKLVRSKARSRPAQGVKRLSGDERKVLVAGEQAVERARQTTVKSRQPRFADNPNVFLSSVWPWLKRGELEEPIYQADSRRRDAWLSEFWKMESHLAGVVSSVVAIDTNRGWALTGGRNQVSMYKEVLLHGAEDGEGWRTYASLQSESFYTTDINAITETGRAGESGPLRAIWHVDPTRCMLTGDIDTPLEFTPANGKRQKWYRDYFWRVASMPSINELYNRLGFCAVSRALEFAKVMFAVFQHDQEQLLARAPRGIMLLHNIDEQQWFDALAARQAYQDGLGQKWFNSVITLASSGTKEEAMAVVLQALSQLPANFDKNIFTSLTMYGYALCFGYDPSEFWPVQFGAMGRGTETAVQHRKGTAKGGLSYILFHQERIQDELPQQLTFEYEQRDAEGEILDADLAIKKAELVTMLFQANGNGGAMPLLGRTWEEAQARALSLLAEQGVIPREWTELEEDSEATDLGEDEFDALRERALSNDRVLRSIAEFPDEPIVHYTWPMQREVVLWKSGKDAKKRHKKIIDGRWIVLPPKRPALIEKPIDYDSLPLVRARGASGLPTELALPARIVVDAPYLTVERATSITTTINGFDQAITSAVLGYMERTTSKRKARTAFERAITTYWPDAARSGWEDGGADPDEFGLDEEGLVEFAIANQTSAMEGFFADLDQIRDSEGDPFPRARLYTRSLQGCYNEWLLRAKPNRMLEWWLGNARTHCLSCKGLAGSKHSARYWLNHNRVPGQPGADLACGGFKCQCRLKDPKTGAFFTIELVL